MSQNQQITDLEIRIAFLEDSVDTLDKVITRQAGDIQRLEKANSEIQKKLQTFEEALAGMPLSATDEPPPPHY